MPFRTTAFEAASALGWDMAELAQRTGIPAKTLYELRKGRRFVGSRTITRLRKAFPQLSFEQLFVPDNSASVQELNTIAEQTAA